MSRVSTPTRALPIPLSDDVSFQAERCGLWLVRDCKNCDILTLLSQKDHTCDVTGKAFGYSQKLKSLPTWALFWPPSGACHLGAEPQFPALKAENNSSFHFPASLQESSALKHVKVIFIKQQRAEWCDLVNIPSSRLVREPREVK